MLMDNSPQMQPAVLTSWKEIAQHLGKGVRTVQRWEQRFGLPVRRPLGAGHKSTVLARRNDLDLWMNSSWAQRAKAEALTPNLRFGPMFERLETMLATSRALQNTNQELLRDVAQGLSSLIVNCRELQKTRRDTEELITYSISAQMADLDSLPGGSE